MTPRRTADVPSTAPVVGAGELVWDNVFRLDEKMVNRYVGSAGGGSVFNVLANLSSHNVLTFALGVAGEDEFGRRAADNLADLGVEVVARYGVGKRTRVVSESINPAVARLEAGDEERHSFTARCLVCERPANGDQHERLSTLDPAAWKERKPRAFCVDRLTRWTVRAAHTARVGGAMTVLDVGRPDYLRWLSTPSALLGLREFDIVLMSSRAAQSLKKRLGGSEPRTALDDGQTRRLLIESSGPRGLLLHILGPSPQSVSLPPPAVEHVEDDAGAGDTLLAGIVRGVLESGLDDLRELEAAASAALDDVARKLQFQGARGHIPRGGLTPIESEWVGKSAAEINAANSPDRPCLACGRDGETVSQPRPRKVGARANVRSYLRARTFSVLDRGRAIAQCRGLLRERGTAYVIGTGGSFAVAEFVARTIAKHGQAFAQAVRPLDYISVGQRSDFVIVVSYSGSTADCAAAIRHAQSLGTPRVFLLTTSVAPSLAELLRLDAGDGLIAYGRGGTAERGPRLERGFVSIAATVVPCALWAAAATDELAVAELERLFLDPDGHVGEAAAAVAREISMGAFVACFGSGLAWPAMIDLESKFVEAGLGLVQLHESKDFSHGRFVSVLNSSASVVALLLRTADANPYEHVLERALRAEVKTVVLEAETTEVVGALELLICSQFFAQQCGDELGTDIARPIEISPAGLRLYRWKKQLNPADPPKRREQLSFAVDPDDDSDVNEAGKRS